MKFAGRTSQPVNLRQAPIGTCAMFCPPRAACTHTPPPDLSMNGRIEVFGNLGYQVFSPRWREESGKPL